MGKRQMGSSIDDFMKEEGLLEETERRAISEVYEWQLTQPTNDPAPCTGPALKRGET
jgi:hypothetical protein